MDVLTIDDSQPSGDGKAASAILGRFGARSQFPLAFQQRRVWYASQANPRSDEQLIVGARLIGELDREGLVSALNTIVARHAVLRTTFQVVDGEPAQVIGEAEHSFELIAQEGLDDELAVERILEQEANLRFDLSREPLIRGRLLQIAEREHLLLLTLHRIVSDSTSVDVLLHELATLYDAFTSERGDPLPELELQFSEHVLREQQEITEGVLRGQFDFWAKALSGTEDLAQLPTDWPRSSVRFYASDRLRMTLSPSLTARLRELSRQEGVTLAETLLSGWAVLLARWGGGTEVVVGVRVRNRRRPEAEPLIGCFENTVALRLQVQQDPRTWQCLKQTRRRVSEACANGDVPFEWVIDSLQERGVPAPAVRVLFEMDPGPMTGCGPADWNSSGVTLGEVFVRRSRTEFELTLSLKETTEGVVGTLEYARDLFERDTVERILASWEVLLGEMAWDIQRPVGQLSMLTATERSRVLYQFNETAAPSLDERLIHELFEQQVRRTPNATAVKYEEHSLSYAELNEKVNRLAHYLAERGVRPDQPVALCVERGPEMVAGMLGILKAGGAFVPMDPAYPADRLRYMLEDAAPRIVLTQERLKSALPPVAGEVIAIDGEWNVIAKRAATDPRWARSRLTPLHLAFVIYTSGSTGKPKGAMNEHRGMANRILAQAKIEAFDEGDICCQKTSISFVDAVFETLGPLCSGQPLVIFPSSAVSDSRKMAQLIAKERVTRLVTVPSLARSMLHDRQTMADLSGLRSWTLSGEEVRADLLIELQRQLPKCEFIIQYGSSEVSSDAAIYKTRQFAGERVPLGWPLPNVRVYVLDHRGEPVPTGVIGEINVAGIGVGRGYLNRPELTAKRFLPDPFSDEPQARLYKTGDLGRWRPDGTLEYFGRNDHQVKIRGFRIELGEIENQLLRHTAVREAVVVAREDVRGEKRLAAYVTLHDAGSGVTFPLDALRSHLAAALPDFMVPAAIVVMEQMPLTPNGKLNRAALPAPNVEAYATKPYESPRGPDEEKLARIWEELLQIERVGRNDNFFQLGGHSLLILQMTNRLQRAGVAARIQDIYASTTLADLAGKLTPATMDGIDVPPNLVPQNCAQITPEMLTLVKLEPEQIREIARTVPAGMVNIQDIYPLTPLQEGMLFHHMLDEHGEDTYVEATLLSVSSEQRLDELISALQRVIDRYDILRTAVVWERLPAPLQVVYRHVKLPVDVLSLDPNRDKAEQIREWMKPERQKLDMRQAPLMRLQVAKDPDSTQWYALLQLHHMLDDDVALKILISEIITSLEGRASALPEPVPFREHVAQALAHAQTRDSEAFFRAKLQDVEETTAPFGLLDVHGGGSRMDEASDCVEQALAQRVRAQARRLSVSAATLFHAAWALVVARTSGRDDVVFGSVLLGRLRGGERVRRIVGTFINTLPLRLRLRDVKAQELVEQCHQELLELLNHEHASLAMVQRCSGIPGSAPLFTSSLNYRHSKPDPEVEWSGAPGIALLKYQYRTNYPVSLSVDDMGDVFGLVAQTERPIDPHRLIGYVKAAIQSLVEALEQRAGTSALSLQILPDRERHQVIEGFNTTQAAYPSEKLIHELFEEQVARAPGAIAVVFQNQSLTYEELNTRANRLAHYLRNKDVGPDQLVALCVDRSVEMLVGLIGVLKAGGAYVPLDPANPMERLELVLTDARPRVVLTQQALREKLPPVAAEVIALDHEWEEIAKENGNSMDPRSLGLTPQHLAYVIYTSGSTGKPKGVMVEHRNIVNYAAHALRQFDVASGDGSLICTSFSFDLMLTGLYPTLLCGQTVRLCPERDGMPALSEELVKATNLSPLKLTPSHLPLLEEALRGGELAGRVRVLVLGGEPLQAGAVRMWRQYAPTTRIFNHYGPTETTVGCIVNEVRDPGTGAVPIGRPISNTRVLILDARMQPVAIGVAGDIYIGGAGVSRGYLNRPDLTAERFTTDPFSTDPKARLYKTGDLGRWRPDGTIEYIGRSDNQVKIRGHRIELGEIETQLRQHPKVKEAVVLAHADDPGDKRLVAYVVADSPRIEATSAAAEDAGVEMVDQWNKVYEETYSMSAPALSFIGWDSSYTGQPIPDEQMEEWLSRTVERIRALKPTRILEIGCGGGLVLQHLAPQASVYVATDFSASALRQLQRWMSARNDLRHVEILHRSATELRELPAAHFDTIVLNSVVQYFPNIGYLLTVVQDAVRLLRPQGRIFLGDIRHVGLLQMSHSAIQLSKAPETLSGEQLRNRVARSIAQEKELLIDPDFFRALPGRIPGICAAEMQLKRGLGPNEMTRYRYDVVLHIGDEAEGPVPCERRDWADVGSATEFEAALAEHRWPAVLFTSIPNSRLAREAAAQRLIATADEHVNVSALRAQLSEVPDSGMEPEEFWKWGEAYGYDVMVTWSDERSAGSFDVQLVDRSRCRQASPAVLPRLENARPWHAYANDPLENGRKQQLIPELREYLKERLPDYMVPSAWLVLKQLPLTPNGKVDRRKLPAAHGRPEDMGEYVAPQTELERALADIWAEVLRVEQVGVHDNFFDFGGHSLLAMQVVVRIRNLLSIELPMRLLFEFPTIRQLSAQVDSLRHARLLASIADGGEDIEELLENVASLSESRVLELVRELGGKESHE